MIASIPRLECALDFFMNGILIPSWMEFWFIRFVPEYLNCRIFILREIKPVFINLTFFLKEKLKFMGPLCAYVCVSVTWPYFNFESVRVLRNLPCGPTQCCLNRGAHIFQDHRSDLKIWGLRKVIWRKFHTEDPQILGTAVKKKT